MSYRVKRIEIRNILGIESLDIEPGALTVVSGANAMGKTSVLTALKDLADGGHDPSLLRRGAEQGSVTMLLENGTEIFKVIKPAKSVTTVVDPQMGKISKPASWIKEIMDGISLDPVQFLMLKPKPRVDVLLGALPIELPMSTLGKLGIPAEYVSSLDVTKHPLKVLDELRKTIFGKRRELNTMAREKRSTASQMRNTLPPPPEDEEKKDWKAILKDLQQKQVLHRQALMDKLQAVTDQAGQTKQAKQAEIEAQIRALQAELEGWCERINEDAERDRNQIREDLAPVGEKLAQDVGTATAWVEADAKAEKTREMIAQFEGDAGNVEASAKQLTGCLDRIQDLKAKLLENIPIRGLELADGDFEVDGVPFDRLNDAEKHRIAIEIAKLKAGKLGLILMDRTEIFDASNWESFVNTALASGLQVIAGKVTPDGELTVETKEAVG